MSWRSSRGGALARTGLAVSVVVSVLAVAGCDRTVGVQNGQRGTGMVQMDTASRSEERDAQIAKMPKPLRRPTGEAKTAAEEFENVQVMGDLSTKEFARLMLSIKSWVAADIGCDYCHNAPDYASDEKYTKVVAREMLRMTRRINRDWGDHVAQTGVTCFTCHRGQPVPPRVWFALPPKDADRVMVRVPPQRMPTPSAARSAWFTDSLAQYLLAEDSIRVVGTTALPTGDGRGIKQAWTTNQLMMVFADSLGVNCTFCHNAQAFISWEKSPPQRVKAWHGIRMVRDLNRNFMLPLTDKLPLERLGPTGDVPKVFCATCHMGVNKPLGGTVMLTDYPELIGPKPKDVAQQDGDAGKTPSAAGNPQ